MSTSKLGWPARLALLFALAPLALMLAGGPARAEDERGDRGREHQRWEHREYRDRDYRDRDHGWHDRGYYYAPPPPPVYYAPPAPPPGITLTFPIR
ncbi:hypothetical protein GCM10011611_32200 [Aliidongia dinghuensis]|uniref:Secreted protein n=1 Tax=Aliidongia dinghuensis TaxID=1867774 RepID=A0A8J2YUF7_9PROT|nr:hypothetical protein [Aliidongia dinghuensis]GGF23669.1 hypothetical protein GCM10011611_32200 [Aliidongia dinghuensis]